MRCVRQGARAPQPRPWPSRAIHRRMPLDPWGAKKRRQRACTHVRTRARAGSCTACPQAPPCSRTPRARQAQLHVPLPAPPPPLHETPGTLCTLHAPPGSPQDIKIPAPLGGGGAREKGMQRSPSTLYSLLGFQHIISTYSKMGSFSAPGDPPPPPPAPHPAFF